MGHELATGRLIYLRVRRSSIGLGARRAEWRLTRRVARTPDSLPEESESGPDPSMLVPNPENEGTRVSPVPSGHFFQGRRDTARPPNGPCRADDSVRSNGSGDSDH